MPSSSKAERKTAYPNGEGIYVQALRIAEQRALARGDAKVLPLRRPQGKRQTQPAVEAA